MLGLKQSGSRVCNDEGVYGGGGSEQAISSTSGHLPERRVVDRRKDWWVVGLQRLIRS